MPIGTRGGVAQAAQDEASEALPPEARASAELNVPRFDPALPSVAAAPCSGCVELQVDVSDINQRDEFAIALGGVQLTRVVWTVLVNFNSDQLAVQPFVDDVYGKYTSLHVNTFPLATAVEVAQDFEGKAAQRVGLKVGSSGAWTGNQTMSVFVNGLRIEGPGAVSKTFDVGPEGFAPRTGSRNPRLVFHPLQPTGLVAPVIPAQASVQVPAPVEEAQPRAR
ncbi:MAG: hypothetical protein RL685_5111 [Pseudomonadota bacterium]|jgi:hypothetical protein